jgi:hypothetical protein
MAFSRSSTLFTTILLLLSFVLPSLAAVASINEDSSFSVAQKEYYNRRAHSWQVSFYGGKDCKGATSPIEGLKSKACQAAAGGPGAHSVNLAIGRKCTVYLYGGNKCENATVMAAENKFASFSCLNPPKAVGSWKVHCP